MVQALLSNDRRCHLAASALWWEVDADFELQGPAMACPDIVHSGWQCAHHASLANLAERFERTASRGLPMGHCHGQLQSGGANLQNFAQQPAVAWTMSPISETLNYGQLPEGVMSALAELESGRKGEKMQTSRSVCVLVPVFLWSTLTFAQQRPTVVLLAQETSGQDNPGPNRQVQHPQKEPCWKQVGIAPSVMQQQTEIQRKFHSQIGNISGDTSLSEQQKTEKIQDIRRSTQEQLMKLTSPAQREKLKECQVAQLRSEQPRSAGKPVP